MRLFLIVSAILICLKAHRCALPKYSPITTSPAEHYEHCVKQAYQLWLDKKGCKLCFCDRGGVVICRDGARKRNVVKVPECLEPDPNL